jgi:hypothetical protein
MRSYVSGLLDDAMYIGSKLVWLFKQGFYYVAELYEFADR